MKTLFLSYSFEGNCRALARHMAERLSGDVEELHPLMEKTPASGFMKYFIGGRDALFRATPAIKLVTANLHAYDLVFIGSPVWFGRMTPTVRSFLTGADLKNLPLAFFAMHRGGPGSALSAMRKLAEARGGRVVAAEKFVDLRKGDADATRRQAADWAEQTLANLASPCRDAMDEGEANR